MDSLIILLNRDNFGGREGVTICYFYKTILYMRYCYCNTRIFVMSGTVSDELVHVLSLFNRLRVAEFRIHFYM